MSGISPKIGYRQIASATAVTVIKTGPAGLYGIVALATTMTDVTVYDGITATYAVAYKGVPVLGTPIHFGGVVMGLNQGLAVIASGTGSVNVLYT